MLADILLKVAGQFQEPEHDYYPRPSLAGPGRCTRQMVFWSLGHKAKELPGRTLVVFDDGNWHEELTLNWLRKSAYQVHSQQMKLEIPLPNGRGTLKGSIDGIVTDLLGKDYLLEHKAINHFTFEMYRAGTIPEDYITQVCLYLRGLYSDNPDIDKAVLLIKNKNTGAYLEFIIWYDYDFDRAVISSMTDSNGETKDLLQVREKICGAAGDKFHAVKIYTKEKRLPKRDYFLGDDWHCDYCGYKDECWGDYRKEFTELKTDSMLSDEVADMIRYYRETGSQKKEIDDEYKKLSKAIKDIMKQTGAREGKAGEFLIKLSLIETNRVDKELLTPAEIEKATVQTISERLSISNLDKPKKA